MGNGQKNVHGASWEPSGKGHGIGRKSQLLWHILGSGDGGGRGLCIEHPKRVCVAHHNATWVLIHLGRWRPKEVVQQTNVEGVVEGGKSRLQSLWDLAVWTEPQADAEIIRVLWKLQIQVSNKFPDAAIAACSLSTRPFGRTKIYIPNITGYQKSCWCTSIFWVPATWTRAPPHFAPEPFCFPS